MPRESLEEEWDLAGLAQAIERDFADADRPEGWLEADDDMTEDGLRERVVKAVEDVVRGEGRRRSARRSCGISRRR